MPVLGGALGKDRPQEVADFLAAGVVGLVHVLVEDVLADVFMDLELEDRGDGVVVVVAGQSLTWVLLAASQNSSPRGDGGTTPWMSLTSFHHVALSLSAGMALA